MIDGHRLHSAARVEGAWGADMGRMGAELALRTHRAYCMVIRGIPTHSEGILVGHEVAKSQV